MRIRFDIRLISRIRIGLDSLFSTQRWRNTCPHQTPASSFTTPNLFRRSQKWSRYGACWAGQMTISPTRTRRKMCQARRGREASHPLRDSRLSPERNLWPGVGGACTHQHTLRGSSSGVSKPIFATKCSFCRMFRDLQDFRTFAPL